MSGNRFRTVVGLVCLGILALAASAAARASDGLDFGEVARVVAVGDLHGDYDQYLKVLRDAGLVNARGKWTGGDTHLVQTGDITDRGADSRRIIDHLEQLKKQAARKGGRVHTLIGNHEAMNATGDLRYVHPGEFQAFTGRRSGELRERQIEFMLKQYEQLKPEEFMQLDLDAYRAELRERFPLGWVEHRMAWMPDGDYGRWLQGNPVAVKVNGTLFVHGGFSGKYCAMSLEEMAERAHREIGAYDPSAPGMIEDPEGPLWYRGLAEGDEDTLAPLVDGVLDRYGAQRIVMGHTPTGGVVWPRFDGRVVANDTGIAAHYGGHDAFLELTPGGATAVYGETRLALPESEEDRLDYLRAVIELRPDSPPLKALLQSLLAPPPEEPAPDDASEAPGGEGPPPADDGAAGALDTPAPAVSRGICRAGMS